MSRGGDFWSRRKARVQAAEAAEAKTREAARAEAALAEKSDAEICAELDLPDPDSLAPGDDVRAFMARAVPERLRRRALRRLWAANPALANLDALVDYGEDYTDAARVVADMQTAYRVGRGFVREVEAVAAAGPEPAAPEAVAEETGQDISPDCDNPPPDAPAPVAQADETPAPPPRRRMRFAFDGTEPAGGRT